MIGAIAKTKYTAAVTSSRTRMVFHSHANWTLSMAINRESWGLIMVIDGWLSRQIFYMASIAQAWRCGAEGRTEKRPGSLGRIYTHSVHRY